MAERVVSLRMGGFPRRSHGSPSLHVSPSVPFTLTKPLGGKKNKQTKGYVGVQNGNQNTQELAGGKITPTAAGRTM